MNKKTILLYFLIINVIFIQIFSQKVQEIQTLSSIKTLITDDYVDYMVDFSDVDDKEALISDLEIAMDESVSYEFSLNSYSQKVVIKPASNSKLPITKGKQFSEDNIAEVVLGSMIDDYQEDTKVVGIMGSDSFINTYSQTIMYDFDYLKTTPDKLNQVSDIVISNVNMIDDFDKKVEEIDKLFDEYGVEYQDGNTQRNTSDFVKEAFISAIIQVFGCSIMLIIVFIVSLDVFLKTIRRKSSIKKLLGYDDNSLILFYVMNYMKFFTLTIVVPVILHFILYSFMPSIFSSTNFIGCVILAIIQLTLLLFLIIFQIFEVKFRNIREDL